MKKLFALTLTTALLFTSQAWAQSILNVSYDPTRELYNEFNQAFKKHWEAQGHESLRIQQSHGGSGKQARTVIDGLRADIVTLALAGDIDQIAEIAKLLPSDWQTRLPDASTPYTSTIVFLVRKDNPKNIKDWDDLVRSDIKVITPNPKTSGGARWNFLAAWAYALEHNNNNDEKAFEFVQQLYKNVLVLDSGARGATNSFAQNKLGDVLIAWENEAFLVLKEQGASNYDIVVPSLSILAEPPVALIDKVVDRKGTREVAQAYLEYLYSEEGQRIAAKNYYRPRNQSIANEFSTQFPALKLVTIDQVFGGWKQAQPRFFNDGGVFDQLYNK
ncbi:sulfate ABC transporter substrate-binding protein [Pseudomonas sp. F1_0610]|uniref:sulfate ABC transporter substrate-binding protein n=1 Tax=Pseudomonas sp. F1_0610 TaxID=3114284 RepID=UPI0039C33434